MSYSNFNDSGLLVRFLLHFGPVFFVNSGCTTDKYLKTLRRKFEVRTYQKCPHGLELGEASTDSQ